MATSSDSGSILMLAAFGLVGYYLYTQYQKSHAQQTMLPSAFAPPTTTATTFIGPIQGPAPGTVIINPDGSTQVVNNDGTLTEPS